VGKVIVDREGFMELDSWGEISEDDGAAQLAAVIVRETHQATAYKPATGSLDSKRPSPIAHGAAVPAASD
jgi:hypothetical protein